MADHPHVWNRRKGSAKAPPGAIYVGRPTRWGNPFPVQGYAGAAHELAVQRYRESTTTDQGR